MIDRVWIVWADVFTDPDIEHHLVAVAATEDVARQIIAEFEPPPNWLWRDGSPGYELDWSEHEVVNGSPS